jgi:hypothetical protein
MQQGRRVHEFDRRGELDMAIAGIAAKARGGEGEHRPQAFAARRDEVVGDFRDHRDLGAGARQNRPVDQGHIVGDQGGEPVDDALRRLLLERNDNSHGVFSLVA